MPKTNKAMEGLRSIILEHDATQARNVILKRQIDMCCLAMIRSVHRSFDMHTMVRLTGGFTLGSCGGVFCKDHREEGNGLVEVTESIDAEIVLTKAGKELLDYHRSISDDEQC